MNLKFHMQHDQTPKLQNSKIVLGREFKIATVTKTSNTNKIFIFSKRQGIFGLNIFISFYNYTSIQTYMMIIQAMGLEGIFG